MKPKRKLNKLIFNRRKPNDSKVHFSVVTQEPYGVCCIQGLKISMGMHNFGEKRWGSGLLDDFRSVNDQNTRIIGDFTKTVRQPRIAEYMNVLMKLENWPEHFLTLVADSKFPELDNEDDPFLPKLEKAIKSHAKMSTSFNRQTLQTRFFETGDNYYLGMELTREFEEWKKETVDELVKPLAPDEMESEEKKKQLSAFKMTLMHNLDRLWYEACLEIIRRGDVYNPGARRRVPRLYLINSCFEEKLFRLPIGESFRLSEKPEDRYEIVHKTKRMLGTRWDRVVVRNVEGQISKLDPKTLVRREGNLTRAPDGNQESRVSLATFPVGHHINHRTARLSNESKEYVFAFIGDEQATPHFMRYSGLTGACINAMLLNDFVRSAVQGLPFMERFQRYSRETNWSNSEVVTRGTGSNFGQDGFLRPGFSYTSGVEYLHSKVIERLETQQDINDILSRDWKAKFAASIVPRGMELNENFISALYAKTRAAVFDNFLKEVQNDRRIATEELIEFLTERKESLASRRADLDHEKYWTDFLSEMDGIDDTARLWLQKFHGEAAKRVEQTINSIVEFATTAYLYNERVPSEVYNQPKPVDSIVDDFAVEAQNLANSLVMSAAFSAGALAFVLYDLRQEGNARLGDIWAGIIAGLNILLSFGTMTNVSRYKIRNEEARIMFFDKKFLGVKKAVFSSMDMKTQDTVPEDFNPFLVDLEEKVENFVYNVKYYGMDEPHEFNEDYGDLKANINNPLSIRVFQGKLAGHFIADAYHVNSYLQENLVDVYKVCESMHTLLTHEIDKGKGSETTRHLFNRLTYFAPNLEYSLQRGHVYWGFLKQRKFLHWDICVCLRYFYSLFCCAFSGGRTPLAPIQTETLGILRETRKLSNTHDNKVLGREIRDLEALYWATRESDVASLIFVSAFLVHVVSWIFSIARIITLVGGPSGVTDVAFWATLASAMGAILAAFHFQRKFFILFGLWCSLFGKSRQGKDFDDRRAIGKVRGVTFIQLILTFLRLLAAIGAGVAMAWSVASNGYQDKIGFDESLPFWIALGAVCAAVGSTIFFFLVEYMIRYSLSPKLGEFVCEAFREEIEGIYETMSVPVNDIDPKEVQERETWEYVAREFLHKYRFDTVFAADRFGSILQYIQSGMESRREP
jgi:macrodomain Ter protein organizer (MatP/YcbG family)